MIRVLLLYLVSVALAVFAILVSNFCLGHMQSNTP